MENNKPDQPSLILQGLIKDMIEREQKGKAEYGTTVDRTDYTEAMWIEEGYEESLDLAIYMAAARATMKRQRRLLERVNLLSFIHWLDSQGMEVTEISVQKKSDNPDKYIVIYEKPDQST